MSITPSKYIKENRKKSTFNFKQSLTDRIGADTFNTDIEQFNKDYSADYLSNWHSAEDINTYYDRLSSLNDRTKAYQSYVNLYGTDEQKSVLGDIGKQISAYDEMIGKRQDVLDYYGGFGSAEEYGKAIEQSKADQEFYNTYDIESARNKLKGLEDAHKSPLADPLGYISDGGEYYGKIDNQMRALESEISRWENIDNAKRYSEYTGKAEYNPEFAKNSDFYDFVTKAQKSTTLEQMANPKNTIYKNLKDSELKKFYSIYEEQGEDEARKYLKFLAPYLEARNQADVEAAAKNFSSWMSVYAATQDILGVPIEQINDYIDYGLTGRMGYNKTAQEVETIQGAVTEDMSGFGSFLYNTASSGATSLAAAGISKLAGGPAGEILLSLSAAAHTQNDILSRGGNSNQAAIGGIAAGAFEALFEHVSISNLKAFETNDWIPNLKNAILEVANSAGVNASEEMLTEIANIAFDMVNMGELSNAVLQYEESIKNGATKAEAFWNTLGKNIMQVAEAGASGALMGVGFGAIGTTSKVISRARAGKQVIKNANNPQEFTLDKLLKNSKEIFKGDKFQKEQRLIADIEKSKGRTDFAQKNRIGLLTEAYFTQGFKESNRELAEDSVNNIEKTKKTIENEATKTKVDNTNPTITNDNLPKILGFKEGKLSETVIETENGATAFTEESAANADIGTLYACAIRLGNTQSANNFVQNWDGITDPFQYYLDFLKFQMRGTYAPDSYDKTMTDYAGVKMSPAAKHAAFQSGISLRESTKEKIAKQSEELKGEYEKLGGKAKKGKFNDSKLNYSALTKEQKDVVNFTRILSDYLGVNVEFFVSQKGKRGANGYYKAKNNTIYLDIYAGIGNKESYSAIKDCLINTMSHEIVHNMKVTAPTEYAALRDFIIDKLSKQEGYDLDAKIEQIIAENSDQGFTVEDAIEEIVAMSCEDLLGSSEKLQTTLTEFYAQNEKAANSFTKYVREVLNRLKAFFEKIIGKKSIAEESQLMAKQSAEFISELQKRYDAALLAMREGNAVRNTQNATEGEKAKEQKRTKNIFGFEINKNASVNEDLLEELSIYDPTAEVNENGEITVYHRTSKDGAEAIRKTGIMKAKEDALFFSSKPEGYASDYGDTVITLKIPSTKLRINDIFDGEVHFDMPLKRIAGEWSANVSQWLVDEGKVMKQARANTSNYLDYDKPITLKDIELLRSIGRKSINEFTSEDIEKAQKWAYKFYKELGVKSPFFRAWFGDWREYDDVSRVRTVTVPTIDISQAFLEPGDYKIEDAGWTVHAGKVLNDDTRHHSGGNRINVKSLNAIRDILQNAVLLDTIVSQQDTNKKSANTAFLHKLYTIITYDSKPYIAKITVEEYYNETIKDVSKRAYNLKAIKIEPTGGQLGNDSSSSVPDISSIKSISDLFALVKQYDKEFSPKTSNPLLLDENKQPKVFYHGSGAYFTVFDIKKAKRSGLYGKGFYFTDSDTHAGQYGNLYAVYLNVRNPLTAGAKTVTRAQVRKYLEAVAENEDYSIENYGTYDVDKVLDIVMDGNAQKDAYTVLNDINAAAIGDLVEATKLFNDVNSTKFDGIVVPTETVVFEPTQIKSATDNIGTFDSSNPDIRYQKRIETPGASEVLSDLFRDNPNLNGYAEQKQELKSYKELLRSVRVNEQRIAEIDAEIKSLKSKHAQSGKGTRIAELYEMRKRAEDRVKEKQNRMFKMEATSLKEVIQKETARLLTERSKEERDLSKKQQKEIRENYARREYIKKIEDRAKGLTNAVKNVGDKHVPAPLREAIADLVMSLDFSSKSKLAGKGDTKKDIQFADAFRQLANLVGNKLPNTTDKETAPLDEFFIDCDITDEFRNQFEEIKNEIDNIVYRRGGSGEDTYVLRNLSSEQLRQINSALYKLGKQISKANQLMENNLYKNVIEMSEDFLTFADKFVLKQDVKWLEKLIDVDNLIPYYAFKRMGKVGMSLFNEWADGMDKYAKVAKEVVDTANSLYTAKEIKEWNNTVHEIEIKGKKLYFTTAHLMSFYCLWKREAAKSHISGYGIRVETFDVDKTAKNPLGKTYTNPANGVHITDETAQILLDELNKDKRAKVVADALQKYMSTRCAELANEITMKRFGEKAYTEEFYFPMEVNENEKPTDGDINAESLYALVNKSFTKQLTPNSTSSLTIRNIFDVFASHTTDVAAYHSLAIPLLDTLKFYNYKQKGYDAKGDSEAKTVRGKIVEAFGEPFLNYLKNFIKDTTGTSITSDRGSDAVGKWVSRYKIAAVAANLRVIVLQPTSYLRVSAVMKHRYLVKEIKDIPHLKEAFERMNKYSGVALWKTELGFRDVNISKSLADKIKHADTIGDKVTNIAMKGAELADNVTWANIWLACEEEIKATEKNIPVGSDAFYDKVSKRFRDVIYSTQVVDSPLAKSNMARAKSFWNRTVTSFMSEPVVSHNLLLDAYHELADAKRRGEKIAWENVRKVGRLVLAYTINATAQAVVSSLVDAARKIADDEDEEFADAYWGEFISNLLQELNPLSKIPRIKDIIDVIRVTFSNGYYSGQSMETAVFDRVAKAVKESYKFFSGESSTTKLVKRIMDAISSLTGIPIGNTYREIKTIWNNLTNLFK